MSGDFGEDNHLPQGERSEGLSVLHDGERLFEIVLGRLAWYCGQLTSHLLERSFY